MKCNVDYGLQNHGEHGFPSKIYLKILLLSRSKHGVPLQKSIGLMKFEPIISVYYENDEKHMHLLYG